MAQPTQKFFGSLKLKEIGDAVRKGDKVTESDKYGKQLKVTAAQWEDGGISLQIYDPETKTAISIGNLRVSQFNDEQQNQEPAKKVEDDLPF